MKLSRHQHEERVTKIQRCIQGLNLKPTAITKKEAARAGKEYLDWVLEDSRFQWNLSKKKAGKGFIQEIEVKDKVWRKTTKEFVKIAEGGILKGVREKACQMKKDLDAFAEGKLEEEQRGIILEEFRKLLEVINEQEVRSDLQIESIP